MAVVIRMLLVWLASVRETRKRLGLPYRPRNEEQSEEEKKLEYRAVIKFLTKEGVRSPEIHQRLCAVYGSVVSLQTVYCWSAKFRGGENRLSLVSSNGRSSSTTMKMISAVKNVIEENRRNKIRDISITCNLAYGTVYNIIHCILKMRKLCARWVPRLLTEYDKVRRRDACRAIIKHFQDVPNFADRIITGDETWVHHHDPETKAQSMQWCYKTESCPIKALRQKSAGKIMATIFWDSEGVVLVDFLCKGQTMNGDYYAVLMLKLDNALKEKRAHKLLSGNLLLLHDNATVHKCHTVRSVISQCCFTELIHPPYSPDLAPSDYYLFPKLKLSLKGNKFISDNEVCSFVYDWLHLAKEEDAEFYRSGLLKLRSRSEKCIAVDGGYVEKCLTPVAIK